MPVWPSCVKVVNHWGRGYALCNEKSAQRDANTARWLYKAEPKMFVPPQMRDGQNLISWTGDDYWNETDRSATYEFLFVTHSNHEPISYNFRKKRRFRSKIAKLFHLSGKNAPSPLRGSPWNFVMAVDLKKTRMMPLLEGEKWKKVWWNVQQFPLNPIILQTDGQTDGNGKQYRALRDKN